MDRSYARDLARKTGHLEALDFIDVAEESHLEDLVSHLEAESERTSERTVKTLQGWHEYGETHEKNDWDDYCKPGDEVDREVYDHFLDILTPRTMKRGYFQVGEPYSMKQDKDGNWKETWTTFAREGDKYYYLGNCFAGKREHQP